MKKLVLVLFIIFWVLVGSTTYLDDYTYDKNEEFIRLHVLANSDTDEDQAIKYAVKDAIVKEFSPIFSQYNNILEARDFLENNLASLEKVARAQLEAMDSNYTVKAQHGNFYFPTKYYGTFSLPAGKYEAVRVVIGEGKGANWWCVLFPPLCFVPQEENCQVGQSYTVEQNTIQVKCKLWDWLKSSFATIIKLFGN